MVSIYVSMAFNQSFNKNRQTQLTSKKIMISTTISSGDYEYVKKMGLMFSKLLENAISIHRVAHEEGISENYVNYLKHKITLMSERLNKANSFIEANNLGDEYTKLTQE